MLLSARGLTVEFGGLTALGDVDLDVQAGEILGVIGPNGAGKTTLFNTLCGQVKPRRGAIAFAGADITGWSTERVARAGLVKTFQTSRPFGSMSFLDNVAVGALAKHATMTGARSAAARELDRVGLGAMRDRPARGASTGQRKRLEVARALAAGPQLLLLDEPFGGVDVTAIDELIRLLHEIRATGITIALIEHNLDAVHRLVDRLIALDLGQRIASGTAAEVTTDPRVVRAYLGEAVTPDG